MGKKDKKKSKEKEKKHDNTKKGGFSIKSDVKEFAGITKKKFKKEYGYGNESKKEVLEGYFSHLQTLLPDVLSTVSMYGHIDEVKELKPAIFEKITNPGFAEFIRKSLKDGCDIENIDLMPIVINEILAEVAAVAAEQQKDDAEAKEELMDTAELIKLAERILKDKKKKLVKKGFDEKLAFDVLMVMPVAKLIKKSPAYHMTRLMKVLYAHGAEQEISFAKFVKVMFNEEEISIVVMFNLLERKVKMSDFNASQKKLFNEVTTWCLDTLESMKKADVKSIVSSYVKARKYDESRNRDGARRYTLSTLPETDYPKIVKVVADLIELDPDNKKYL